MKEAVDFVSSLGPTGLLGLALFLISREYLSMRTALDAEKAARLADARENTTKMLALVERVYEGDEDSRRSRHD
jgi:hypothetical protein